MVEGQQLTQSQVVPNLSDLFTLKPRVPTEQANATAMQELVNGALGARNPTVCRVARTATDPLRAKFGFPEDIVVSRLYTLLQRQYVPHSLHRQIAPYLLHMQLAAKCIYEQAYQQIRYISDPPGEWFKPALHTLIVEAGDCDDWAILLCSLWASIGFKTYLGFQPGHVFPGIYLGKLAREPVAATAVAASLTQQFPQDDRFYRIESIRVPGDNKRFRLALNNVTEEFNVFHLAFQDHEFRAKMQRLLHHVKSLPTDQQPTAETQLQTRTKTMFDEFHQLYRARTFDLEPDAT
jgi:hypothetical protein